MLRNLIPLLSHIAAAFIPLTWGWAMGIVSPTPILWLAVAIFGILPDIDTASSHIGRLFYPVARLIESNFGHRTITHSLAAVAVVALFTLTLFTVFGPWLLAAYISHLFVDMIVGDGLPLFYPARTRFEIARIRGSSDGETWVALSMVALVIVPFPFPKFFYNAANPPPRNPELVTIHITNIYDPSEITVKVGDIISKGTLLADLKTHRIYHEAQPIQLPTDHTTPPPISQPTNIPIPTPDINPTLQALHQLQAAADLAVAQAIYSKSLESPPAIDLSGQRARINADAATIKQLEYRLFVLTNTLGYAEATGDWREVPYLVGGAQDGPKGKRTDLLIREAISQTAYQLDQARQTFIASRASLNNAARTQAQAKPSQADIAYAQAQYNQAIIRATLVSIPPTPTALPSPTPTTTPQPTQTPEPAPPLTLVHAAITGKVIDIKTTQDQDRLKVDITIDCTGYEQPQTSQPFNTNTTATVTHVTDGDTITVQLNNQQIKVRLIGIDTPESVKPNTPIQCFALQASAFTKAQLLNKQIRLEYDTQQTDTYGRTLAYVWLDSQLFNEVLAQEGYAQQLTIPPNVRYAARFYAAVKTARQNNKGLWAKCINTG
jgi:endonuclease YncB( thermonuclease family)/membrane-bound metal-dependent hydrolase YbcI (DUF457 family)